MLIVIHGSNYYLAKQKLNDFKNKFTNEIDSSKTNLMDINGENLDINQFTRLARSSPFLASKRMIIVHNFINKNKNKNSLIDLMPLLQNTNNIIVFFENKKINNKKNKKELEYHILKQKFVYEFEMLKGYSLTKWTQSKFKEKNINITSKTVEYFISFAGNNLQQLKNEIYKLQAYCFKKKIKTIEPKDIDVLINNSIEYSIFLLIDSIANKNKKNALNLVNTFLDKGYDPLYILAMIVRQFRILISVKTLLNKKYNEKKIAASLKQHPYTIKKTMPIANHFTFSQLNKIYYSLIRLDKKLKTQKNNNKLLFDLLLLYII